MKQLTEQGNTKQAMWLGISSLSTFAMGLVSSVILSRYFDKTEYGTYRQILYVYTTLLVIFTAGLPAVYSYYLPRYSFRQGKDIVRKITLALVIGGMIFSILLLTFSGLIGGLLKNPELENGLKIFSAIPLLMLPTMGLDGIFSSYKNTIKVAAYNIVSRTIMLMCIVLPVILFKGTYKDALYGWIVASVFILLLAVLMLHGLFKDTKAQQSFLRYKEIFNYSLPVFMASIWSMAIKAADQYYISRYYGTEVFAEFSNGFIELPFLSMITYASSTVILPVFSKMNSDNSGTRQVMDLWNSMVKKSAIIIYPLVMFCLFTAGEIIVIMYSESYRNSALYFEISLILNFFNIVLFSPLMFSIGKTRLFSQVHFYFAAGSWTLGYVMVIVFNSPLAIAICSIILAILRVFVFIFILSSHFGVSLREFLPFRYITTLIIHSGIIAVISKFSVEFLVPGAGNLLILTLTASLFFPLLILTSGIFRLNYFQVFSPLLKRIKN